MVILHPECEAPGGHSCLSVNSASRSLGKFTRCHRCHRFRYNLVADVRWSLGLTQYYSLKAPSRDPATTTATRTRPNIVVAKCLMGAAPAETTEAFFHYRNIHKWLAKHWYCDRGTSNSPVSATFPIPEASFRPLAFWWDIWEFLDNIGFGMIILTCLLYTSRCV